MSETHKPSQTPAPMNAIGLLPGFKRHSLGQFGERVVEAVGSGDAFGKIGDHPVYLVVDAIDLGDDPNVEEIGIDFRIAPSPASMDHVPHWGSWPVGKTVVVPLTPGMGSAVVDTQFSFTFSSEKSLDENLEDLRNLIDLDGLRMVDGETIVRASRRNPYLKPAKRFEEKPANTNGTASLPSILVSNRPYLAYAALELRCHQRLLAGLDTEDLEDEMTALWDHLDDVQRQSLNGMGSDLIWVRRKGEPAPKGPKLEDVTEEQIASLREARDDKDWHRLLHDLRVCAPKIQPLAYLAHIRAWVYRLILMNDYAEVFERFAVELDPDCDRSRALAFFQNDASHPIRKFECETVSGSITA